MKIDFSQRAGPHHCDIVRIRPIEVGKTVTGSRRVALAQQNLEGASGFVFAHQEVEVGELTHRDVAIGGHCQGRTLERQWLDAARLKQRYQANQLTREMAIAYRIAEKSRAQALGRSGWQRVIEFEVSVR